MMAKNLFVNLLLFSCSLFVSAVNQVAYNPDYASGRISVRVSEILKKNKGPVDISWPPPNHNEYTQVNIQVMDRPVDPSVVNNLHPDVSSSKQRKLRKILGSDFDAEWTSVTLPTSANQHPRGAGGATPGGTSAKLTLKSNDRLVTEVRQLNLTMRDPNGGLVQMPPQMVETFQLWLLDHASCAMKYLWEDLGVLFWPRWIRRGVCLNTARQSCSWPPGMKCRSSGSRALKLLHWKCTQIDAATARKISNKKKRRDSRRMQMDQNAKRRRHNRRRRRNKHRINRMANDPSAPGGGNKGILGGDPAWRASRKRKRVRRLIKKLSMVQNGYQCQWTVQKYLISDKCTCSCS